jgi:hypothetical protein
VCPFFAGAFLFLAPWLFGFSTQTVPTWNAWLVGAVVVLAGLSAADLRLAGQEQPRVQA